jgi:hypothetical protein
MMEESGAGSVLVTNGSGCGRPKNIWILRIRIRNTEFKTLFLVFLALMSLINSGYCHLIQNTIHTIIAQRCLPNFGPEHAACVPSLEMLVPPGQALVHEANIRACSHKKVLSRPTGAEQFVFCRLYPRPLSSYNGSVWVLRVISLLLSRVKAGVY